MLRRASSGPLPPLVAGEEVDETALTDLDIPRLVVVGSGFYTALNCCTYPLAVVKTRMQANPVDLGSVQTARELLRSTGVRGFYAGLGPVLLGAVPARAGYITALESTRPVVQDWLQVAGVDGTAAAALSNGAAGFAAVFVSQLIYTPTDVVTQRMMVAQGNAGGVLADASASHVVRDVLATSGWRGLYRGLGVTLATYVPGGSTWWAAYGGAREAIAGQQLAPATEQVGAAVWASMWATAVTGPMDVVKTRIQLSAAEQAPSIVGTARALIAAEGIGGLYRGFLPRWGQASIFTSCVISLYEWLKVFCRKPKPLR